MADEKILIVEDENIEAMDIKLTLESFDYIVPYIASSGEEAVNKSIEIMPDLILMDVVLKGDINGIEAAKKIKKLNIPIIFLTAHSEESTIQKAKLTEPYGYIIKPYDATELKYAIELAIYKNRSECDLKESEERYRNIIENIQDAYLRADNKCKIVMASPSAAHMYKFGSSQEMIGTSIISLFKNPEDKKVIFKKLKKYGTVHNMEGKGLRKDGTDFWVSMNVQYYHDVNGNIQGTEGFIRDISESKKAEETLKKSESYYKAIFNHTNAATVIIDVDTTISLANNEFEKLSGYSREELEGTKSWTDFVDPRDLDRMKEYHRLRRIDSHMAPEDYNFRFIDREGNLKYIQLDIGMIPNTSKSVASLLDVTKSKMDAKALYENEKKYRTLFEIDPDYTILLDLDGCLVDVNQAAVDITGLSKEELVGKHFTELKIFPEEELRLHLERFTSFASGEESSPFESSIYDANGKIRFIEIKQTFIKLDDKIEYVLLICSDITQRKKAENEIRSSLEEKDVLLQEIHHRVKNNMQIISSLLNLQKQYVNGVEALDVLMESQNRVRSMAMIHEKLYQSNDLTNLKFSDYIPRLVSDLLYSYKIPVDQIKVVINVEDVKLNIETAVPCGLIINELVSNSFKHAYPDEKTGELRITLKVVDDNYELVVSDDGIGFPKELDYKNTHSLGLLLVTSLVKQLDGEIFLDKDNGTTFKIVFKRLKYDERV